MGIFHGFRSGNIVIWLTDISREGKKLLHVRLESLYKSKCERVNTGHNEVRNWNQEIGQISEVRVLPSLYASILGAI